MNLLDKLKARKNDMSTYEANDYRPLQSAHVLAGVATVEHGTAARVFTAVGLERAAIIEACRDVLDS